MRRLARYALFGLLVFNLFPSFGYSCTTFRIDQDNQFYLGKNYDWSVGDALLIVNKRGVKKVAAMGPDDEGRPAVWTSKYGSVTFNQYGREFPTGGMNEAGLVVETMALRDSVYPAPDSRPVVKGSPWKQYHLDNFSTVEEVIASQSDVRILKYETDPGVHFLISDKTGRCAAIEFLDGKTVVHTGDALTVMALTNTPYAESVEHWREGTMPIYDRSNSVSRFIRAATMVAAHAEGVSKPPVDYAFDILSKASNPHWTKWSIVYDQNNLRIHFITNTNGNIRIVDMKKFDFSCRTPVRVLDANAGISGDVTDKFRDYTQQINRDLIGASFGKTSFLQSISSERLDRISRFPDRLTCEE